MTDLASPTRIAKRNVRTRRWSRSVRQDLINGLLFISPWLIGLLIFTLYPLLASLYYSFTDYNVLQPAKFVGATNFTGMFAKDHLFWTAVRNTLIFALMAIPLNIVFSICLALLLNVKVHGMSIYRTIFYLPSIFPQVVTALLFSWMLNPQFGLVNSLLKQIGLPTVGWLTDPTWAKPSLVLLGLWGLGGSMVIYLAALQDVPQHLYEAAELDGAGALTKTWTITLPMISPTIFFNLVLGTIDAFQSFTFVYVLTDGQGGPLDSTLFYGLLLYRNAFKYLHMGYASAMAWLLALFVILITLVIFKSSGRWVYYGGEGH
jgi:multiple sugar transport system permease protein